MKYAVHLLLLGLIVASCQSQTTQNSSADASSNEEITIDAEGDEKSITLVTNAIEAMGGMEKYNNTRHLSWNFFGFRKLWWDKYTGDVRIEIPGDSAVYLYNVNTEEGKVKIAGQEFTEPDTLNTLLKRAKSIWINDSYWLVMPFKMLDEGVKLKYLGPDATLDSTKMTEVVEMTFDNVGETPQNKYHVHFDTATHLVAQWEYFSKNTDNEPRISNLWKGYQSHDGLLLSGDRGQRKLSEISVYHSLPKKVYSSFDSVD